MGIYPYRYPCFQGPGFCGSHRFIRQSQLTHLPAYCFGPRVLICEQKTQLGSQVILFLQGMLATGNLIRKPLSWGMKVLWLRYKESGVTVKFLLSMKHGAQGNSPSPYP